ncbi:MAG: hypothetical protein OXG44_15120 [Gammaproteobacteria bacterium]|nr:hypothetical protein [Gammaproteobacteria bacterium]
MKDESGQRSIEDLRRERDRLRREVERQELESEIERLKHKKRTGEYPRHFWGSPSGLYSGLKSLLRA